jgi:small neutral amino acid transporter SnatA (MarC family)
MKKALIFAAIGEATTGLALLIVPSLVGQLLLGEELTGIAIPVARVAGLALIASIAFSRHFSRQNRKVWGWGWRFVGR